jgi:flagellar basal-body rod modification protein FlgD
MDRDDFLLLLVTQLSHQDPMSPMDAQDFAAQLAQFSSVEQLTQINDAMALNSEMNGLLAQSVNAGVAAGLINKTVVADGDQVFVNDSEPASLNFDLSRAAADVTLTITNEAGSVVRTIELNTRSEGTHEHMWDGLDDAGNPVSNGTYHLSVSAADSAGVDVPASALIRGSVDRISFGTEGIQLWLGSTSISMGSVRSVEEPE